MKQKRVIKSSSRSPKLSLILLDWSCRDWFGALDFLNEQDAPRDSYELIWVECHDRVVDYVREHADTLITLGQEGLYHKHKANNAGLLAARGEVVTFLDSDALYPRNYVSAILNFFFDPIVQPRAVLYLNQMRAKAMRPEKPTWDDVCGVNDWDSTGWNYGQGMSVPLREALLAGGFDEHEAFRGFHSGPSELGFRLLNFGLEEVWLREPVSWHFNHENSTGNPIPDGEVASATIKLMSRWPKVQTAFGPRPFDSQNLVLGLVEGRHLPLTENLEARQRRLLARKIPKGLMLMEGFMNRQPVVYLLFGAGAMVAVILEMLQVSALVFALGSFLYSAVCGAGAALLYATAAASVASEERWLYTLAVLLAAYFLVRRARSPSVAGSVRLGASVGASLLLLSPLCLFPAVLAAYEWARDLRTGAARARFSRARDAAALCAAPGPRPSPPRPFRPSRPCGRGRIGL